MELIMSGRKLKASIEGSKGRICKRARRRGQESGVRDSGGWAVRAREYMPGEEDRKALCAVRVCDMPARAD